jgi:hypothetical protein
MFPEQFLIDLFWDSQSERFKIVPQTKACMICDECIMEIKTEVQTVTDIPNNDILTFVFVFVSSNAFKCHSWVVSPLTTE